MIVDAPGCSLWFLLRLSEKHVFAGEVSADHLKQDEMEPAKQDLLDFGVYLPSPLPHYPVH